MKETIIEDVFVESGSEKVPEPEPTDVLIHDPTQDCKLIGAARALGGITDSITIVHARPGCHCGVLLLRAMSSNQNDIRIVSSGFRMQDMVYGAEGRLANAMRMSNDKFSPALLATLNCSAPAIIGDDVEGVAIAMNNEIPAQLLTMNTGGYEGPAWKGYEETLNKLTEFMVQGDAISGSMVNLIGLKQDDVRAQSDLSEIKRMLNSHGIEINSILTYSSFEEIRNAPQASLNLVLGGDGLECARIMEERFAVPYVVVPYPYGLGGSLDFMEAVLEGTGKEIDQQFISQQRDWIRERIEKMHLYLQGVYDLNVAVIGEGAHAFDLARFLSDELSLNVKVLAVTSKNHISEDRASEGDYWETLLIEPDRFTMNETVRSCEVDMVFGSTMEKKLAHELHVPLIRTFYPLLDDVSVSDSPYAGFRGMIHLIEDIINSIIHNYTEV